MERSIEYRYHRNAGHELCAYVDTDQVCGIVKRSKIGTLFHVLDDFLIDHYRACEFLSAMDYTMSYGFDLGKACDRAGLFVYKCIKHIFDSLFMSRHGELADLLVQTCLLIYETSVNTDTLAKSFCEDFFRNRVDELILQRRASAVDYQYFHF